MMELKLSLLFIVMVGTLKILYISLPFKRLFDNAVKHQKEKENKHCYHHS